MIRHREVDVSSPEGPGFNFVGADLNEAPFRNQDHPRASPCGAVRLMVAYFNWRLNVAQKNVPLRAVTSAADQPPFRAGKRQLARKALKSSELGSRALRIRRWGGES